MANRLNSRQVNAIGFLSVAVAINPKQPCTEWPRPSAIPCVQPNHGGQEENLKRKHCYAAKCERDSGNGIDFTHSDHAKIHEFTGEIML
jgi:hypothetical protein